MFFGNTIKAYISASNSSTTNLAAGNSYTFTGTGEITDHPDVMVNLYADQIATISIQFSIDGTNWDSSISKTTIAGQNKFTTAVKGYRYVRIVVTTASLTTTVFRLQTQFGLFRQGNLPLSAVVGQDADALLTRSVDTEIDIANGKYAGYDIVLKLGRNQDIDSGSVPEDIWCGGGTYTGFPTGAPENLIFVSTNAGDTGVVTFSYLPTSTSTAYVSGTVTLNGVTPVNSGVSAYRVHTANYASGSSTAFNLGLISCYHQTTTSNIFFIMQIGRSQTNACVYTVPFGQTAYLKRIFCQVVGSTSGQVSGDVWIRTNGGSPRLRRPFLATAVSSSDIAYGGITVPGQSDITMRINYASTNNLEVIGGFDILQIKN